MKNSRKHYANHQYLQNVQYLTKTVERLVSVQFLTEIPEL